MSVNYYGSRLSPHIIKNSDGFLICKDVPIARTGTQKYLAREIGFPERGNEIVTVYRTDDEVFTKKAMDSYNGVPFVNEHPSDFVSPKNVQSLIRGTVTNVHRGTGMNSDLLLADIIVYGDEEINEIIDKLKREISCGYSCSYEPYKDGYRQVDITGNHVALVSAGRAGNRVAIQDTAESTQQKLEGVKKMGYRIPRKSDITDFVNAVGLKTLAADAEPEEVQEMVAGLVDEKRQAEQDAEPIVIEPEMKTNDEEVEQLRSELANVKDAIYALLTNDEEMEEVEDEEVVEEEDSEGMESLDALEEELTESEDEDVTEQVEEVEEAPEQIDEETVEEEEITTDSILELAKVLKPIIASVPNKDKRKQMSDSLATVLRKHVKKTQDSKKTNYSMMLNRTTDSAVEEEDYGMKIAKMYNPHYKEEK